MLRSCLALALASLLIVGCGGSVTSPSASISTSALKSAALSVTFAGKTLTLASSPSRDLMPMISPADNGLRIVLTVKTSDGSALPSGTTMDAVWALDGSTVWSTWTLTPVPGGPDYVVNATKGPTWNEGTMVTAVIRLKDAKGDTVLLRAPSRALSVVY